MSTSFASTVTRALVGTFGTALCAGLCLVAATAPAHAETVRSTTVSAAGIDLTTAAGRAKLDRRINAAAHNVCDSNDRGLVAAREKVRCIHAAVAAAKTKVYAPQTASAD